MPSEEGPTVVPLDISLFLCNELRPRNKRRPYVEGLKNTFSKICEQKDKKNFVRICNVGLAYMDKLNFEISSFIALVMDLVYKKDRDLRVLITPFACFCQIARAFDKNPKVSFVTLPAQLRFFSSS